MKHHGNVRDDRFGLTTLQISHCEVRTRAELLQATRRTNGTGHRAPNLEQQISNLELRTLAFGAQSDTALHQQAEQF